MQARFVLVWCGVRDTTCMRGAGSCLLEAPFKDGRRGEDRVSAKLMICKTGRRSELPDNLLTEQDPYTDTQK